MIPKTLNDADYAELERRMAALGMFSGLKSRSTMG